VGSAGRPTVEFFYCASCPWTWLALARLREAVTRTGAAITYRPILAAWIDDGPERLSDRSLTSRHPAVAAYARKDLQDWARFCGPEIRLPQAWPFTPEWAQRGAVLAIEAGVIRQYAESTFHACFTDGRDIAQRAVVLDLAAGCGMAGDAFEARLAAEATGQALRRNTDELARRAGFGSPTFFLGDDMYFGHDRMPLLEAALMRSGERPFIAPGEHGR
jgi:2-hydroxychromene-2-carboxylate isomerase